MRKPQVEIIVDRMEVPEKVKIQDPKVARKVVYKLHLRSIVPRKVERYQGNCDVKLEPSDEGNNDYLVIKSFGKSTFMVKGESHSTYGPQYVLSYEDFPFAELKVGQKTL